MKNTTTLFLSSALALMFLSTPQLNASAMATPSAPSVAAGGVAEAARIEPFSQEAARLDSPYNVTALNNVVVRNQEKIVQVLSNNINEHYKQYPDRILHLLADACMNGYLETVKVIIATGKLTQQHFSSGLICSVELDGDPQLVKLLLQYNPDRDAVERTLAKAKNIQRILTDSSSRDTNVNDKNVIYRIKKLGDYNLIITLLELRLRELQQQ